jgi:hypothetical protein
MPDIVLFQSSSSQVIPLFLKALSCLLFVLCFTAVLFKILVQICKIIRLHSIFFNDKMNHNIIYDFFEVKN